MSYSLNTLRGVIQVSGSQLLELDYKGVVGSVIGVSKGNARSLLDCSSYYRYVVNNGISELQF